MANPKEPSQKRPRALKLIVASAATAVVVVVWGLTSLLSGLYASQAPPGQPVPVPRAHAGPSGGSTTGGSGHGARSGSGGSNAAPSSCDLACQQARAVQRNEGIILPRPPGTPAITQQQLDQARATAEASATPKPANNGPTPTPTPTVTSSDGG